MAEKEIAPLELSFPNKLRILPLSTKAIYPGIITPLILSSQEDLDLVDEILKSDSFLGLVLTKEAELQEPDASNLYKVGTLAKILKKINLPDGGINIIITTIRRFTIKKFIQKTYPFIAAVTYPPEKTEETLEIKALNRALLSEMKIISENNPLFSEDVRLNMVNIDHPGKIADFTAGILNLDRKDQQKILNAYDLQTRMEMVLVHIKKEQELLKIQKKIQNQINEKIEKSQRDYVLKEQLKLIKQELGIATDNKTLEQNRFQELFEGLKLPEKIQEAVKKELDKFNLMDPNSSEYNISRNYLDTIFSLPWNPPVFSDIDLKKVSRILNADHYGLDDVKERILEFMAVRKKTTQTKGSIICLVGPPGVGKTSIGKSIAHSLGKEFFRFSVGGMRDEAEIKGHRRTYIGAMPGKILQGLKTVKTRDPVFMIDEIDKLGQSYQGDPASALLEVLDPEQNTEFRDHYLDLPFDLSSILFIVTANTLDSIPAPLLDRMEIIRLSGYIAEEKQAIAKKYLLPKSLKKHGLSKDDIQFDTKALRSIIDHYAREAGVRNLEKYIDKICRKVTYALVSEEKKAPLIVEEKDLESYLGKAIWDESLNTPLQKPGMVTGLAWTNFGGDTLTIEAIAIQGKEGLTLTGQMGKVMQESANIAFSLVRSLSGKYKIPKDFFSKNMIHLHIPAGATPKDGPSAGITMATCILSLASGKLVKKHLAMTGELSLSGQVLPIGGLKEKTIAAKRSGIKDIIIPKANERDLEEIPETVKKGLVFHPVLTIDEVFNLVFPSNLVNE